MNHYLLKGAETLYFLESDGGGNFFFYIFLVLMFLFRFFVKKKAEESKVKREDEDELEDMQPSFEQTPKELFPRVESKKFPILPPEVQVERKQPVEEEISEESDLLLFDPDDARKAFITKEILTPLFPVDR